MNYLTVKLTEYDKNRIFSKISIDPITKCWNWIAAKTYGYGSFRYKRKTYRIHRFIYAWIKGPIPTAKYGKGVPVFDHLCRNHACCNPDHLELVSQKTNLHRGNGVSGINSRKTLCIHGHTLPKPTKEGSIFTRRCIICRRRNRMRRYYANKSIF